MSDCESRFLNRRKAMAGLAVLTAMPQGVGAQQPERIALLSDTHIHANPEFRRGDDRPLANLTSVLRDVVKSGASFGIVNGDLACETGSPGDYQQFSSALRRGAESIPFAFTLGNHDHRQNFVENQERQGIAVQLQGKHYVNVIERNYLTFVMLDSLYLTNEAAGLLGKAQRTWLSGFLSKHTRPVALFVHHTIDDEDVSLLDSPFLNEVANQNKQVKVVFYGHSHAHSVSARNGLHLVNLPATAWTFSAEQKTGWVLGDFAASGCQLRRYFLDGRAEAPVRLVWR